jgi:hypothetical protein
MRKIHVATGSKVVGSNPTVPTSFLGPPTRHALRSEAGRSAGIQGVVGPQQCTADEPLPQGRATGGRIIRLI